MDHISRALHAVWCPQVASGLAYCFSIYSLAVTERLGYTEVQVNGMALALNFGGYFAIPCGLLYEWLEPYDQGNHLAPR